MMWGVCASSYTLAPSGTAVLAMRVSICKGEKFFDHAPLTIAYDFEL